MQQQTTVPSSEVAGTEHRQAYGTAKTENLRDSGLWRTLLPAAIVVFCLALLAIPLIMLVWLLATSVAALAANNQAEGQLTWLWLTMIVLVLVIVGIVIRGLYKTFMTQAGNYNG
ncbi:MAG TPA: hypothetical protein VKR06_26695 [Ktedonosporobacter sp.]|nr:hypothetical protein [Ktedonosporobacter sp.]